MKKKQKKEVVIKLPKYKRFLLLLKYYRGESKTVFSLIIHSIHNSTAINEQERFYEFPKFWFRISEDLMKAFGKEDRIIRVIKVLGGNIKRNHPYLKTSKINFFDLPEIKKADYYSPSNNSYSFFLYPVNSEIKQFTIDFAKYLNWDILCNTRAALDEDIMDVAMKYLTPKQIRKREEMKAKLLEAFNAI